MEDIIHAISMDEVRELAFPVAVLDDLSPSCPVVACSDNFAELIGMSPTSLLGCGALPILEGTPDDAAASADTQACLGEYLFARSHQQLPAPPGEMCFVHSLSAGSSSRCRFRGLLFLKRVRIENRCLIVVLLLELPALAPAAPAEEPASEAVSSQAASSSVECKASCATATCEKESWGKAHSKKANKDKGSKPSHGGSDDDGGRLARQERKKRIDRRKRRDARAIRNMREALNAEGNSDAGGSGDRPARDSPPDEPDMRRTLSLASDNTPRPPHWQPSFGNGQHTTADSPKSERLSEVVGTMNEQMAQVEGVLARNFWYESPLGRQARLPRMADDKGSSNVCLGAGLGGAILGFRHPVHVLSRFSDTVVGEHCCNEAADVVTYVTESNEMNNEFAKSGFLKQLSEDSEASTAFTEVTKADSEDSSWVLEPMTEYLPDIVQAWDPDQYELVRRVHSAARNQGCVCLMREIATERLVAAKVMPNEWVQKSPEAFIAANPNETERPWMDISCSYFLHSVNFDYAPEFVGVYRDSTHTSFVSSYIDGGDLFDWASELDLPPGPEREAAVKPIMRQLALALKTLHNKSIAHRDLSCENVLVQNTDEGPQVKIIDFAAATNDRWCPSGSYGKPSYQAPEMFEGQYDSFLSDAFAFGVMLYGLCLMDYPWIDLHGRGDKCVQFVRMKGFHAFMERKKLTRTGKKVVECVSSELGELLAGLLNFDPEQRLSLGETALLEEGRKSIWDEPWFQS